MHEPNWVARIIGIIFVVVILGVLVGGYIVSNRAPHQQPMQEAVPNDRLPG
jgi:hypothetical protein